MELAIWDSLFSLQTNAIEKKDKNPSLFMTTILKQQGKQGSLALTGKERWRSC